jgi:hypothetical protein
MSKQSEERRIRCLLVYHSINKQSYPHVAGLLNNNGCFFGDGMKEFFAGILVIITVPLWGTAIIICLAIAAVTEIGAMVIGE